MKTAILDLITALFLAHLYKSAARAEAAEMSALASASAVV